MCGIAGCWEAGGAPADALAARALAMADALAHRGPDDRGAWTDAAAGVALGFRRLAILDLSPQGRQPMASADGRYTVVFNGEIYNWADLRAELERAGAAPAWRGHSDTEIMLAAISHWGLDAALRRMTGMFAIALWDARERTLHLVRDRMGEKPLYYGAMGGTLLFGSELKALRTHPAFVEEIDRAAVAALMRFAYVPAPRSIFRGIRKLPAGSLVSFRSPADAAAPRSYWTLRGAIERGLEQPFSGGDAEATDELERLLRDATARQMVADVPLGAFLSGGVDSSTVVALMQAQSSRPVKTFTIGFHEEDYNEAPYAKAVAQHLGTDHTELYLSPAESMAAIPDLPRFYDEPFADSSQLPTYLVSRLARTAVTVSLSGDGGDELFGGYNRYFWGASIWRRLGWMPRGARRAAAGALTAVSPPAWDRVFEAAGPVLPARVRQPAAGDKLHKLARAIDVASPEELYAVLVSHWTEEALVDAAALEFDLPLERLATPPERMMACDAATYLPDDILVKVDRATMAVSLESRIPLLDHRVVEFAWRLPLGLKLRDGAGKWLLRQVLYRHVPRALIDRQKMGFSLPLDAWLRGPLRDWAEALLEEKRLAREGFLDPKPVRARWREHLSGRRNWQHPLWIVLMFQAWLEAHPA
jgi:asparagine synthase (glutamine-hydrolysing)